MSAQRLTRIDAAIQKLIDDKQLAGAVTIVARRGKVIHFGAHGMRDIAAGKPMEQDTIFRIYSMTKAVVSVAAVTLVEETAAVARGWAPQDAWSLAEHLLECPAGRARDAATVSLIESLQGEEPLSAWSCTARIDDTAKRRETRIAVMHGWADKHPVHARAALEGADISESEREVLDVGVGTCGVRATLPSRA